MRCSDIAQPYSQHSLLDNDLSQFDLSDSTDSSSPSSSSFQNNIVNLSRCIDNDRVMGNTSQSVIATEHFTKTDQNTDPTTVSYEVQTEVIVGSSSGLVIGIFVHWLMKGRYPKKVSVNPFYRNFKVLGSVGASIGTVIGYALPLPKNMQKMAAATLSDLISIFLALFAFPYWLIRKHILKTPEKDRNIFAKVGLNEGWSKYGKTCLVYGITIGQLIGAIHSTCVGTNLVGDIALTGGISGLSLFFLGLILIPIINKYNAKSLQTDRIKFRNSYIRTGMILGAGVGSIVGFVLGTFLFPGIGSLAGMAILGSLGGIIGGALTGINGGTISEKFTLPLSMRIHRGNHTKKESENTWDYSTRSTFYLFASLGTAIGFCLPIPGGSVVGAALGAAIGGVVGWTIGYNRIKVPDKNTPPEKKANTIPWTQRMTMGANIFSIIGGVIGLICGLLLAGPPGALAGATLGYAIGSFIGGIVGLIYDPKSEKTIPTYSPEVNEVELIDIPRDRFQPSPEKIIEPEIKLALNRHALFNNRQSSEIPDSKLIHLDEKPAYTQPSIF